MKASAFMLFVVGSSLWISACSSSSPAPAGPSCKSVPVNCEDLPVTSCNPANSCELHYSCAGTASCEAALTSSGTPLASQNCQEGSPGCTWTGTTCMGTPLPCTDPMYQANTVACENVGCTLASSCGGGAASYDCAQATTQDACDAQPYVCAWE
jgi:hypothetical protein